MNPTHAATHTLPRANPAEAFYKTSRVAMMLGAVLRGAQALAPGLAVRMARRVFCTPLPPRWMTRRAPVPRHWERERWAFERASLTVYRSRHAQADAPLVLMAHGWGGFAMQWEPMARDLLKAGFDPVLVDFPAHGASDGATSTLPQFARAIEYVAGRLASRSGGIHALVAHSLGANAAAQAVARGVSLQRLVLVAPMSSPRDYTGLFARVFGLSETTRAAMQAALEAQEAIVMPQFEPAQVGPRIAAPTLVVHDRDDTVNPHADGEAFARAVPQAHLLSTSGLGHRKPLRDAAVAAQVVEFLGAASRTAR